MAPTPDDSRPVLCLDIETARQDALILHEIGLYRPDTGDRARISGRDPALVARVDALTDGAEAVLGHNIVAFDGPTLAVHAR